MASFEIAARFDAPAEKVWEFVSWDGMPRLTNGGFFTKAEFPAGEAIRVGALRRVHVPDGPPFVERLEEYRAEDFFYRYSLVDTGPFPLTDYTGVVKVTPAGSGCCLKFGHTATLVGISATEWQPMWTDIENQVFDYIRKHVHSGAPAPLEQKTSGSPSDGYRWVLQAQADPQLPARILGIFTLRNELPRYFSSQQLAADCVEIEIRNTGDDDHRAQHLARRLRNIPSVIETGLWAPDGRLLEL